MIRPLPGTTIELDEARWAQGGAILDSLFLAGGLTLSQVAQLTGLEAHVIQNWVKRGYLPPPKGRRYSRSQFCRVALINMLRGCFRLEQAAALLSYLNGSLADQSDDIIDDSQLYLYVLRLAQRAQAEPMAGREVWAAWHREVLAGYRGPYPGAEARVAKGLQVILAAYTAAQLRQRADALCKNLLSEGSDPP